MIIYAASVLQTTVSLALDILMFLMFLRAIISWFPGLNDTSFSEFLFSVTEWIIYPVRCLFDAMNWNGAMMIDIPYFITFLLLSVISSLL